MMIPWLDFMLFGNGKGLASPYSDDRFYFLSGDFYHFSPGFGVQLYSFRWFKPDPKERIQIKDYIIKPVDSRRSWPRVMISWQVMGIGQAEDMNQFIRDFKKAIDTSY